MSDTVVSRLTPPGVGAIATVEVRGARAWELARQLFTLAGKPLPDAPELNRFWFGTLGRDEVILAVTANDTIEVHCHGGHRVVRLVMDQFLSLGGVEERTPRPSGEGFELLQRAPTLRTAAIILDQLNGAFANEVRRLLALLETDPRAAAQPLHTLTYFGNTVGRHLIEPWKVVVAGPPNVGKSSLVNALAGYRRSVVSEMAGTTRDAVSVRTAFDGWPVELIDTAGLRDADGLEAEGIKQAEKKAAEADLVLWVMDGTAPKLEWPCGRMSRELMLAVVNKSDAMSNSWLDPDTVDAACLPLVSARTGGGIASLAAQIVRLLVPTAPSQGNAVPYTPHLIELVNSALHSAHQGEWNTAAHTLRASLAFEGIAV